MIVVRCEIRVIIILPIWSDEVFSEKGHFFQVLTFLIWTRIAIFLLPGTIIGFFKNMFFLCKSTIDFVGSECYEVF